MPKTASCADKKTKTIASLTKARPPQTQRKTLPAHQLAGNASDFQRRQPKKPHSFIQAARCNTTIKLTRRRKPEVKRGTSETQGCRRSGAAPCCAAVDALELPPAAPPKYFEKSQSLSAAETQNLRESRNISTTENQNPHQSRKAAPATNPNAAKPRQSRRRDNFQASRNPPTPAFQNAAHAWKQARRPNDQAHPPPKAQRPRNEGAKL